MENILNLNNKNECMGFYSTNTPEQKRIEKLTGDINIHDTFKKECEARGIAIYNAYNIQKRLIFEVESEQLVGVDAVDKRLMELLDERGKTEVPHVYTDLIERDEKSQKSIPPKPQNNVPSNRRPPKPVPKKALSEIKIPPRARDGKTFDITDNGEIIEREATPVELLQKLVNQNQKIINQNKIIIDELKKISDGK